MTFVITCWNKDITTYLPHVSSPLTISGEVVGSKEIPTPSAVIVPWEKRLSVTVGMRPPGRLKVPKKKVINLSQDKEGEKITLGKVDWADANRNKIELTITQLFSARIIPKNAIATTGRGNANRLVMDDEARGNGEGVYEFSTRTHRQRLIMASKSAME